LATATIDLKQELSDEHALPTFWRQPHVYALAGMTILEIGACRLEIWLLDGGLAQWSQTPLLGVLFAQCFLLGLWGALGGLSTLPRWGLVGLIHFAAVVTMSVRMQVLHEDFATRALEWGILGALLVLFFAAILLPLRRLLGWRIDFDCRFYRGARGRRGQLSMMDYAGYSVGLAAALAAGRLAIQAEVLQTDVLLTVAGVILAVVIAAAPATLLLVTGRRMWLAPLLALAWALAIAGAHSCLCYLHEDVDFFGPNSGPVFAGVRLQLAGFYAGIAMLLCLTLLPLRFFGLQLIAVPLPQEGT
jgi:hypothetical protein